ncbi:hypothetical protein HWI79_2708 [Cryptosporidium felis]|nr:hypothetical protein HWI79_2708 [Cryptosporidium felis]
MDRDSRRFLYEPLIDLLRLLEVWSGLRSGLQKNVQSYAALKIELGYVSQKPCIGLNMFSLNENYIDDNFEAISEKLTALRKLVAESMHSISEIPKGILKITVKLSEFCNLHCNKVFPGIIGKPNNAISVDIILDFLEEWRDSIESDIKVQKEVFELMESLESYHSRNIQTCLSYFQCSPYGDLLENKEIYKNTKTSIREFITQ